MINSGGLLSGTDALDHHCCCGLLQAAVGCCWFRCWCCYFRLLLGHVGCVRCRNWLGGIRFLSLLLFTTTSTLLLLLLLLKIIFQVRISFTNAQERSIPTYCTTVTTASNTATTTTAASGGRGCGGRLATSPPLFPLLSYHHNIAKCQVSPSAARCMSQLAGHIDADNTMCV